LLIPPNPPCKLTRCAAHAAAQFFRARRGLPRNARRCEGGHAARLGFFRLRFDLEAEQLPNRGMQAPFPAFPLLPSPQRRVDHRPGLRLRQARDLTRCPDRIRRRVSRRSNPAAPVWVVSHVRITSSQFSQGLQSAILAAYILSIRSCLTCFARFIRHWRP
jgi:hypothetical protein